MSVSPGSPLSPAVAPEGLPVIQARDIKERQLDLNADVVVVGSGSGGAVMAYHLARAGRSVIVLEAGPYVPADAMKESLLEAWETLYVEQGWQMTADNDMRVLQGRCVGGSSVVSAAVMQRTPDDVLKRWQSQSGLTNLTGYALEPYFQDLERDLSVCKNTDAEINANSHKIAAGAGKLGLAWSPVARAVKDCALTGFCLSGCKSDRKQSMLVTYLPWAQACGAKIYADTTVTAVMAKKKKVTGVEAEVCDPQTGAKVASLRVSAKVVVLAAGAIATPRLLKASDLANGSGKLGKRLALNPAVAVYGRFAEPVYGWRGAFTGVAVDHSTQGYTLQAAMTGPEMVQWATGSGVGEKQLRFLQDFSHLACVNAFLRDGGTGALGTLTDELAISWEAARKEHDTMKAAVASAARILLAAGAETVYLPSYQPLTVSKADDVQAALDKITYDDRGAGTFRYFSYFPQGTCQMGFDPDHAVVNPYGECHDVKNLFIADASILPPGLVGNPEMTVCALSAYIADHIRSGGAHYFA